MTEPLRLLVDTPVLWAADYREARRIEQRLQAEQTTAILAVPPWCGLLSHWRFAVYVRGQIQRGRCPWVHAWDSLPEAAAELAAVLAETLALALTVEERRN